MPADLPRCSLGPRRFFSCITVVKSRGAARRRPIRSISRCAVFCELRSPCVLRAETKGRTCNWATNRASNFQMIDCGTSDRHCAPFSYLFLPIFRKSVPRRSVTGTKCAFAFARINCFSNIFRLIVLFFFLFLFFFTWRVIRMN